MIKVGDVLEEVGHSGRPSVLPAERRKVDGKKAIIIAPDDLVRTFLGPPGSTLKISVREPWVRKGRRESPAVIGQQDVAGNNITTVELERRIVDETVRENAGCLLTVCSLLCLDCVFSVILYNLWHPELSLS